tara:strand:+ start:285 stop:440 length:156 start_codon:yes stop_codon:yes gene_type:complete
VGHLVWPPSVDDFHTLGGRKDKKLIPEFLVSSMLTENVCAYVIVGLELLNL